MEAALRTVAHILDPKNEDNLDFTVVRGVEMVLKRQQFKLQVLMLM